MHDPGQGVIAQRRHQYVNMIGHDDPPMQTIPVPIEVAEGATYQGSDLGALQPAGTMPLVKRGLDSLAPFVLLLRFRKPLQFLLPFSEQRLRQAVRQSEADVLGHFPSLKMRQAGTMVLTGRRYAG